MTNNIVLDEKLSALEDVITPVYTGTDLTEYYDTLEATLVNPGSGADRIAQYIVELVINNRPTTMFNKNAAMSATEIKDFYYDIDRSLLAAIASLTAVQTAIHTKWSSLP